LVLHLLPRFRTCTTWIHQGLRPPCLY
jgi:hypothetical protein